MSPHPEADALARFRAALYATGLGRRKDSLFETLDAVLTATGPETLARLSLAPGFRRGGPACPTRWPPGRCTPDAVRALLVRTPARRPVPGPAPPAVGGGRHHLAPPRGADQSGADVLPPGDRRGAPAGDRGRLGVPVAGGRARGAGQLDPAPGRHPAPPAGGPAPRGHGGHPDRSSPSASCARCWRCSPADAAAAGRRPRQRLRPGRRSPAPSRSRPGWRWTCWCAWRRTASCTARPARTPARAGPGAWSPSSAARTRRRTGPPTGRRPSTTPSTARSWCGPGRRSTCGARPTSPSPSCRCRSGRLPARGAARAAVAGLGRGPLPDDLHLVWRWYLRRFTVEHGLRFAKQALGWTTVRPRDPAAADRWTWLVALALLAALARPAARRRPAPALGSPPAPRRGSPRDASGARSAGLFVQVGTPARPPKPRGKSPGRRRGQAPGPHPRCAVIRRTPKRPTAAGNGAPACLTRPRSRFPPRPLGRPQRPLSSLVQTHALKKC